MLDLTGGNLNAYLMRIIGDIVERNPRFRSSLGKIQPIANPTISSFGDMEVVIKNVSSSGVRLSPDYFMGTQLGRALVARVQDSRGLAKEGRFIEWILEVDKTGKLLDPGIYYLNVTSVDESTQEVVLTCHKYQWRQGRVDSIEGSAVYFSSNIDPRLVNISDAANPTTIVEFTPYTNYVILTTPVNSLVITYNGNTLTPLTDYWYQRQFSQVLVQATVVDQTISIPSNYLTWTIFDQTDYTLRQDIDYAIVGLNTIQLVNTYPANFTLFISGTAVLNPNDVSAVNSENILPLAILDNGTQLVPGEVFIETPNGTFQNVIVLNDNSVSIPILLTPGNVGNWMRWEVRIDCGEFTTVVNKLEMQPLMQYTGSGPYTLLTANGEPVPLIPGIWVGIGDQVAVNDQAAIVVSPDITEIYQVYGSKDSVSVGLEVRANDYITASEISETIKNGLLIEKRLEMETDGVTVLEISRDNFSEPRDTSGTAVRYVFNLNLTLLCDWKVFIPMVTRVTNFDIEVSPTTANLNFNPRTTVFGKTKFLEFLSTTV